MYVYWFFPGQNADDAVTRARAFRHSDSCGLSMYFELHSQALRSSVPPAHPAVPPLPSPISISRTPTSTPQAARILPALVTSQEWDVEPCGRGCDGEADGCRARCVLIRCDQPRCCTDSLYSLILPELETTPLLDRDTSCSITMTQPGRRVCSSRRAVTRRRSRTRWIGSSAAEVGVGTDE